MALICSCNDLRWTTLCAKPEAGPIYKQDLVEIVSFDNELQSSLK